MRRVMLGALLGLGLGTAISTHAQAPRTPCAPHWILWQYSVQPDKVGQWWPRDGYPTELDCLAQKRQSNQWEFEHPDSALTTFYSCFPETFNPRPR